MYFLTRRHFMQKKHIIAATLLSSNISIAGDFEMSGFVNIIFAASDTKATYQNVDSYSGLNELSSGGLKLDIDVFEKVSFITQVINKSAIDRSNETVLDIAHIKYSPTKQISSRVGRIRTPLHLDHNTTYFGADSQWILPPSSLHLSTEADSYDGADLTFSDKAFGHDISANIFFGSAKKETTVNNLSYGLFGKLNIDKISGVYLSAQINNIKLSTTLINSDRAYKFSQSQQEVIGSLVTIRPELATYANDITSKQSARRFNIDAEYELSEKFTIKAAVTNQKHNGLKHSKLGYYISTSYKFKNVVVTGLFAEDREKTNSEPWKKLHKEYKASAKFNINPGAYFSLEFTHIQSKSNTNPHFNDTLPSLGNNIITGGLQIKF